MRPSSKQHVPPTWSARCSRKARREVQADENAKLSQALMTAMNQLHHLRATEHEDLAREAHIAAERLWWSLFVARYLERPDEEGLAGTS
jgi:hypothetical protein